MLPLDRAYKGQNGWSMERRFNTAGPNKPERHYTLPVLRRLPQVRGLVQDQLYFMVYAPRQMGKTTTLIALAAALTASREYAAVLVSVEVGAGFPNDIGKAEQAILAAWRERARSCLPPELMPPAWPDAPAGARIRAALQAWAEASPRPLVVLIDEIDGLQGNLLISVLRQLCDGYISRPEHFPWSLCLISTHDVCDEDMYFGGFDRANATSLLNIKSESLTLCNFTCEEVALLYGQHTAETGQVFTGEATRHAFALSQGQPWLVNALARQVVQVLVTDRSVAITASDVDQAKELLIERQDTHLDSLMERLHEERVQCVVELMMTGSKLRHLVPADIRYVMDLGLMRMSEAGGLEMANSIYRESIVRQLVFSTRATLPAIQPTWLLPNGGLDVDRLLDAFLAFWPQHGKALFDTALYHEIAPHLVLMAFLDRVVHGVGSVEPVFGIGRGCMNLHVHYRDVAIAIEIKVWQGESEAEPVDEGLEQLDGYLTGLGQAIAGWLVIFDLRYCEDRRPSAPRLGACLGRSMAATPSGRQVTVVRC